MNNCIKPVGAPKCVKCNGVTIRYGKTQGRQRYRCKACKVTFLKTNSYRAWSPYCSQNIVALLTEGCGIRSIARLLRVATGTVIKRIKQIAGRLHKPPIEPGGIYEVDELKTYTGSKECPCWVILALDRASGKVIEIVVGKRNMGNLSSITNKLINMGCQAIYTDRLNIYNSVIPAAMHRVARYGTNKIERTNLAMRTRLKRLNRKTICYSKSIAMLEACLKLLFWSEQPRAINTGNKC